jgi:hypothetical protein
MDLLHAANLRHGTDGFTSPPKEGVLRIFFALKNPTASAGFEPENLGTKGQHATPRPPKPLHENYHEALKYYFNMFHFRAGTAVAQWLRCCATNWKVAGSIEDGVIGIFH